MLGSSALRSVFLHRCLRIHYCPASLVCFVDPIKKRIVCSGISMASDCVWQPTELLFWHQVLFCEHRTPTVLFLLYYEINMLLKLRFLRQALFIYFFATDYNTVNIKGQHTLALSNMHQNAYPHYFLCANTRWRQLDTPGCISRMAIKIFIVVVGYIVRVICCFQNNTGYSDYQPYLVCQIINETNAIGSSPWWYHLCCSWTVLTFFFWWLATSEGILLSPSRLEWETKVLVVLIKRHAKLDSVGVGWP